MTDTTSEIVKNEKRNEYHSNNQPVDFNVECDDTLSVTYTSCSDYSNSSCNLEINELNFNPNFVENLKPPNANIGSVCVENSTNVTIGNKTYFNGPVIIKHFVVDGSVESVNTQEEGRSVESSRTEKEADKPNPLKNSADQKFDENREGDEIIFCFRNRPSIVNFIVGSVAVIVILIIVAVYCVYFLDDNTPQTNTTIDYYDFEFVDRNKYGAQSPKSDGEPLQLPVRQVIISHTATPNCSDYSNCVSRVLQIQDYHMRNNGWDDIGLNFLVGADGRAYEGCGYTVGAHTKSYNRLSICIAFIGDFQLYAAPEKQLNAAKKLIEYGISVNKIHPDYVVYGQRQLRNFDSPGILLYNQIVLLPHWSRDVIPL